MKTASAIGHALRAHRDGRLDEASALYEEMLMQDPQQVDAVHLLGVVALQRRDPAKAEVLFRRALHIAPRFPAALSNLALLLLETGRAGEAIECLRSAVRIQPRHSGSWTNLGMALVRAGTYEEAASACRTALQLEPCSAEAYCNLGNALRGLKRYEEAVDALRKAVRLRPLLAEAHIGLANVLAEEGLTAVAVCAYEHAHALCPGAVSPLTNLAKLSRECGALDYAASLYRTALKNDPHSSEAHWGLAFVHFLGGNWKEGWKEYEWRFQLPGSASAHLPDSPRWDGTRPDGKSILVRCEQGLGDALQFIRYVPRLASRGASVILEAPETLHRLFKEIPGVQTAVNTGGPFPPHDAHCPLLSLPGLDGTTPETVPAAIPYLVVPAATRTAWEERLARDPQGLRVGIVWSGNPGHENDRHRSIPLEVLRPLFDQDGVVFYTLQLRNAEAEILARSGVRLVDHSAGFTDVLETAGLISQLDLIVTVDTMVAHLAGALGRPVWVLLPFAPDWRWMLGRDDTPWYPTGRLFRQPRRDDWQVVVHNVVCALVDHRRGPKRDAVAADRQELLMGAFEAHRAGDLPRARSAYERILRDDPDHPDALYLLSVISHQTGDVEGGLRAVRRLLGRNPLHADGWNSLGNLLRKGNENTGAEQAFRRAVELMPSHGDAHYNLASCLCDSWRLEEAERHFLEAVRLGTPPAKTRNNIGLVRYRQGRIDEALVEYAAALASDPDCVDAHWNLAHALLHRREYARGWSEYEWRWRKPEFQDILHRHTAPRWDGGPLAGRTILIWSEQGFGDTLQFLRFIPRAAAAGGRVIVECPVPVHSLVRRIKGVAQVAVPSDALPEHDVQIPLLSIPAVLGIDDPLVTTLPYIAAPSERVSSWEHRLAAYGYRLRVGIAWSGSLSNAEGRYRSIPLHVLEPLTQIRNVVFVSLQKGEHATEFRGEPWTASGVDWTDELKDFEDTAALIENLDLILTVDTAVAHLAGAMGKEVWLLLSLPHDWRWGAEEISTWYPTIRLIRQQRRHEWRDVVRHCMELLASRLSFQECTNRGVSLLEAGMPRRALGDLERALASDPSQTTGHLNLAFALLTLGDWDRGFREYEWRLQTRPGRTSLRPYPQPRWEGEELRNRTLFLYAEQGFGDTLQFIRYAPLLAAMGARVVLECRKELVRLLRAMPSLQRVITRGEAPPAFDFHAPLLSLPRILRTRPETIPNHVPYLSAPNQGSTPQLPWLSSVRKEYRIGIAWSGNPATSIDGERSIALQEFMRLMPVDNVVYVSLQVPSKASEIAGLQLPHRINDASPELHDFADTAHVINALDLVVSVDTAVAHLAGAMARPVIVLVPVNADWRWLTGQCETLWYPTMRLVRQRRIGCWDEALEAVAAHVAKGVRAYAHTR